MRGLSGVDLAIQIKAQYPECKIFLFSGQAFSLDLLKAAHGQGHNSLLLQKPVHPSEMLLRIEALATENGLPYPRTTRPLPLVRSLFEPNSFGKKLEMHPAAVERFICVLVLPVSRKTSFRVSDNPDLRLLKERSIATTAKRVGEVGPVRLRG
jgi:hypothetical protein